MEDQLSKWLNGEISDEEFERNTSANDVHKYRQIINEVDKWVPDNDNTIFDPKVVTSRPKETKTRTIQAWVPVSIAAAIGLTIVAFIWFFNSSGTVRHSTGLAEIKEVTLPDGSKVTLASNSEISWKKDEWAWFKETAVAKKTMHKKRNVKMKGKALYEVEKGEPFSVEGEQGLVEVLGTTFEVDEFSNGMNVICFEGKVRATKDQASIIVSGGESALFYDGKWEDIIYKKEKRSAWLQKETKFDNAPLSHVIASLEKLYAVKFETGAVNLNRRFSGTIPNDKLKVALTIVFTPLDINFSQKEDKVYLTE